MHRKSRRLLKNIVILPVENPSHHADNAKKCGAQKIADTLRTRMLGKSPVCQNSGVGKKGEMLESCQHHQQRGKKQVSNRRQKNPFQLMSFVRLPTRTREHQPERIACLGIESSGSRTHDLLLRSTKNRLIHAVLRCYAVFLKPLKYKAFMRISCFSVSPDFVPFFRLFWRPVSKMLAEPKRETNYSELRFESKLCLHVTNLTGKLYEKDNYTSIHYPSRGYLKKRYVSLILIMRVHIALFLCGGDLN